MSLYGRNSIKKNFVYNSLLTVSSFIFPIITFPYISRVLGPEGTGSYNFVASLVGYFSMLSMLGIPTYGIRVCAQSRDNSTNLSKTVSEIVLISFFTTLLAYISFILLIFLVPKLTEYRWLLFIMSISIFCDFIGMEWLFKALEQYKYITLRSLLFKIISIAMVFIFVKNKGDIWKYALIFSLTNFGAGVVNLIRGLKIAKIQFINLDVRRHIKPILVFFAMSVAVTVYTNLDNVMLGFMKNDSEVGIYSAAVKIKYILASLVSSLGAVLLPRASKYIIDNQKEKFCYLSQNAINFVMVVASPLILFFVFLAEDSIIFIAGKEYLQSVIPMRIILPTVLLIGLTNIMGIQMLVPLKCENKVLLSEVIGAIVDLLLNMLLIPSMGATGAAISTLFAELFVFIVQLFALKKFVRICFGEIQYWKIGFGLIVAVLALHLIYNILFLSPFLKILVCSVLFFGMYFLSLVIMKEKFLLKVLQQISFLNKKRTDRT